MKCLALASIFFSLFLFTASAEQMPLGLTGMNGVILPQRLTNPGGIPALFGYPGAKCPYGSEPYKGPETQHAMENGSIYCVFTRTVITRPKTVANGKCPGKVYADPKYKPDADTVWCEQTQEAK